MRVPQRQFLPLFALFCTLLPTGLLGQTPRTSQDESWVESTLAGLSLEAKAAQLVMVRAFAVPTNPDSVAHQALLAEVRDLGVGGLALSRSELDSLPGFLAELQSVAKVPLWVAADVERGLGMRVPSGPVSFPDAMAIGAIPGAAGLAAARFAGELTARESRAAGIHWAFAPVADVNSNPSNPIINLRSYGEDPERVGELVAAFIEGARAGGLLTAAKHFPGHGDTALDSHLELPTISRSRAELERVDLVPFRAAIAAGVDSVMTGHLSVPALDPSGRPATLSRAMTTDLLRGELGFDGLVVTDALEMSGVGDVWMGEAAVEAVLAGADVVLLPPDPRVAVQSLVLAVEEGRISPARLDQSVERILRAKARLGLGAGKPRRAIDAVELHRDIGRTSDIERTAEIAAQSITLVRNEGSIVPLAVEKPLRILHLVSSSDWIQSSSAGSGSLVDRELAARDIDFSTRRLGPQISPALRDEIERDARTYDLVLVSAFVRVTSSKGNVDMDPSHADLLAALAGNGRPVVVLSFGNPYLLRQFHDVPVYLCTYSPSEASQRAAIAALFGEHEVSGRLPVTIPHLAAIGSGLDVAERPLELVAATAEAAGFRADGLTDVDRVVARFVRERAFPGAVIAIGHQGRLAHLQAFGKLAYEDGAAPVTTDTIYDLASLTKVVVTTTLAMMMVDEGRIDLDSPVQDFLPRFQGTNKEKVTIRHLLTHSSGIDWWAPLYQEAKGKAEFLDRIYPMPLVYEPGAEAKYSDLGILLLGEILERASGFPLDELARTKLFEPLELKRTGFLPSPALLSQIAPTEVDPSTGRALHGVVHDENARALGGVAPHAGLFATAPELAKFAQMLIWKGVYGHHRLVSRQTVEQFTTVAELPPGSSRAIGWDTKSREGSSAGVLFSPGSYGHTGFTGTSIWIDPARELFVVLLTNRVHPTREGSRMGEARKAIHDAVVRALVDAPSVVRVGLDRVDGGEDQALRGKRLGLLTHAAAVTLDGRQAVEVLRGRGLDLVRLFSPEHGLQSQAAAGERVGNGIDPASGLPIVSLYGEHRKPTREDLADLDALVVDLQDVGVRFFTYSSTLLYYLEAAAEAGIELLVLDRPNPLGGNYLAGPRRAPLAEVPASFLSMAPGTLVHGLTLGEMARFANAERKQPAKLTVVEMLGWKRKMTWFDTGREWTPPSPNLRSASAALAYPGVALLEATNVSEGRGTSAPFLEIGAPWLEPSRVHVDVPGFRLTATEFTPRSSPAAPEPKYRDELCHGFRIELIDPAIADPWRLGLELVAELSRQPGFAWRRDGAALTTLTGSPTVGARLEAPEGRSPARHAADDARLARWRTERKPALLYD